MVDIFLLETLSGCPRLLHYALPITIKVRHRNVHKTPQLNQIRGNK